MKKWLLRKINGKVKLLPTATSDPFKDKASPTEQNTAPKTYSISEVYKAISEHTAE
jgi:hypothetical protein